MWAVFDEEHVKQESEQIAGRIHHAPVPVDFTEAIEVHGVTEIVVHPQRRMDRVIGAHKRDR